MSHELPPKPNFEAIEAAAVASADQRAEALNAIGRLVYTWSNNESMFIHLLMLLMETDQETAALVFLTLNTTRSRMDLINRLSRIKLREEEIWRELRGILSRFDKLTKIRNQFNHCVYSLDESGRITHTHSLRIIENKHGLRLGDVQPMDRRRLNELNSAIQSLAILNRDIWDFLPRLEAYMHHRRDPAKQSPPRGSDQGPA